jgi:3-isopropylmalate dehydrogenase
MGASTSPGWRESVLEPQTTPVTGAPLIGVIAGEGIGPEVIDAALTVLRGLQDAGGRRVEIEHGGAVGLAAVQAHGSALPEEAVRFCASVLGRGGGVLNGPGGGRYVYELRRRLELFLKISPIQACNGLVHASPLRAEGLADVDLLVVRENLGGVYQGRSERLTRGPWREIRHELHYGEQELRRFLRAAARLASARSGRLTVVVKDSGLDAFSELWRACAEDAAREYDVACTAVEIDLMVYRLLERPVAFDVIAASNLFGDVLSDLAAALVGSRGMSFGASFSPLGGGVYQTNHGAAYDIAGQDRANPVGQLLSLAMLLRESLGMAREAYACEAGIRRVWEQGYRTADVAGAGAAVAGTAELASRIATAAGEELAASLQRV